MNYEDSSKMKGINESAEPHQSIKDAAARETGRRQMRL
jgi:hypothetical protein